MPAGFACRSTQERSGDVWRAEFGTRTISVRSSTDGDYIRVGVDSALPLTALCLFDEVKVVLKHAERPQAP